MLEWVYIPVPTVSPPYVVQEIIPQPTMTPFPGEGVWCRQVFSSVQSVEDVCLYTIVVCITDKSRFGLYALCRHML